MLVAFLIFSCSVDVGAEYQLFKGILMTKLYLFTEQKSWN